MAVKNGQAMVTDLDVYAVVPTDLPDGVYRQVGPNLERYPDEAGRSLDDMPSVPILESAAVGDPIVFPREEFKALLNFVVDNPARPLWGAICFRIGPDRTMELIATDQCALCRHVVHAPAGLPEGEYIVPAKAIRTLLLDKNAEGITMSVSGNHMSLETGHLSVIVRLTDGKYYATDNVMPKRLESVYVLGTKELRKAVKTLAPYLDPETKSVRIRDAEDAINVITGSGSLELSAKNAYENLEKTLFVDSKRRPGGVITTGNLMLVMPLSPSNNQPNGSRLLQYRYLKQVVDSVSGPHLYMGLQGSLSDVLATVFSPEPLCGGELA